MFLLGLPLYFKSRSVRLEIFNFWDAHIGKVNCAEKAIRKQVQEILKHEEDKDRLVRVILGGDLINAINPNDIKRFDFSELPDWLLDTKNVMTLKERLSDVIGQEIKRAVEIFSPIKHLIIGTLEGNHETKARISQNIAVQSVICDRLGIVNLTDEAFIRINCYRSNNASAIVKLYVRHGYGSGRTPGAEPTKLKYMLDEWEDADICLSGHSHTFNRIPPKVVQFVPDKGKMPKQMFCHYRFAANPGCWLYSHYVGASTYESRACYPARPMMTLKIVIWPFWSTMRQGSQMSCPKIELREYPLL